MAMHCMNVCDFTVRECRHRDCQDNKRIPTDAHEGVVSSHRYQAIQTWRESRGCDNVSLVQMLLSYFPDIFTGYLWRDEPQIIGFIPVQNNKALPTLAMLQQFRVYENCCYHRQDFSFSSSVTIMPLLNCGDFGFTNSCTQRFVCKLYILLSDTAVF